MDGFLKLDKMMDWQVANYPLRMSEDGATDIKVKV